MFGILNLDGCSIFENVGFCSFYLNSNAAESASDDLTCGGDDGEGVRIDLLDLLAQADGIETVADGVDHGLFRAAEAADDLMGGDAVIQFADNELCDLLGLFGNDHEVFAAVDIIDNTVNEECFCKQTDEREESDLHAEGDKGAQTDQKVRIEKRLADVQTCVLFEDQRNDIRAAGGGGLGEHDRRSGSRQNDGVNQLKEGLACQRCADGHDLFEDHGEEREGKAAIRRADARFLADEDESDDEKQNVDHGDPRRRGKDRERLAEHGTDTADAARDEAVGDFEEIYADRQKNNADRHQKIAENGLYYFRLFFHIRISRLQLFLLSACLFDSCAEELARVREEAQCGGNERWGNLIDRAGCFKVEVARIVDGDQTLEELFPIVETLIRCEVEIVEAVVVMNVERLDAFAQFFHAGLAVETEHEEVSDIKAEAEAFRFRNAVESVDVVNSLVHVGAACGIDLFGLPILAEHIFKQADNAVCLQCGNEGAVKIEVQPDLVLFGELGEAVTSVKERVNDDTGNAAEAAEFDGFYHIVAQKLIAFFRCTADIGGHGRVALRERDAVLFGSRLDLSCVVPEVFVLEELAVLACLHIVPIDVGGDERVFDGFEACFLQRGEACVDAAELFDDCVMDGGTDLHNKIPFLIFVYL